MQNHKTTSFSSHSLSPLTTTSSTTLHTNTIKNTKQQKDFLLDLISVEMYTYQEGHSKKKTTQEQEQQQHQQYACAYYRRKSSSLTHTFLTYMPSSQVSGHIDRVIMGVLVIHRGRALRLVLQKPALLLHPSFFHFILTTNENTHTQKTQNSKTYKHTRQRFFLTLLNRKNYTFPHQGLF